MATTRPSSASVYSSVGENFLIAEDEALKAHLRGMTVSDEKNIVRPVGVWFALPDMEVRDQSFPFLVVELLSIVEAKDREVRGVIRLDNAPGATAPYTGGEIRQAEYPLPFDLIYQVTAFCRHPRHNRQLIAQMLSQKVPGRLRGLAVPTDNSRRTMGLMSWASLDTVENGRKLWQTVFTISVTSEISDVNTDSLPVPPVEQAVVSVNITESEL